MELNISIYSTTPLYQQLRDEIRKQIVNGTLKPGEKIPTEEEICKKYNVSRSVIKQAFSVLVSDGYLERKPRLGTFVTENKSTGFFRDIISFNEEIQHQGSTPHTKIVNSEITTCPLQIAEKMHMTKNDKVIHIERVRYRDNDVVYYVDAYYNPLFLEHFEIIKDGNRSFYERMETDYGIKICKVRRSFKAISANKRLSDLLGVKIKSALLYVASTEFDQCDHLISFDESYYVGDNSLFNVEIIKGY